MLTNTYAAIHSQQNDEMDESEYHPANYVVDSDEINVNPHVIKAIVEGKMTLAARQIKTFNICRGSVDDCPITTGDWIWCFKRLSIDMTQKFHVVIRVVKVKHVNFCPSVVL